jgi:hypothetical protein
VSAAARSRRRRATVARVVVVAVVVGLALVGGGCSDADRDGDGAASGETATTSSTMATGGIEVAAPDGWTAIPLPVLGFGVAVPPGWEATRLDQEGLSSSGQAAPVVPGFMDAALNAAQSGAVFYAAGVDGEGRVIDLKVRAVLDSGVRDAAGLEDYALEASPPASSGTIDVVADAPQPTVQVRFRAQGERAADDGPISTVEVAVEGSEQLVLSPSGVVYSLIVTSEDASVHDDLAAQIFATLAFPPG